MPTFARPALPAWLESTGVGNLLATAGLLVASFVLVGDQPGAGTAAYVLVPLAVLPLLAMRRYPAAAPVAVAVGVLLAQLVAGPMVTCGVVLPTALIMSFQLGSRLVSTRQQAIGGLGLIGTGLVEVLLDPVLGSVPAAVFVFGLGTTFFIGGLMVRSRVRMALTLRRRTIELAQQRDRTAALAVAADRERIGADLDITVRSRIAAIATAAASGRAGTTGPGSAASARDTLAQIERQGRETLADMRAVVGTLHDAPTHPPPRLGDLPDLVRRATTADVRVRYFGERRPLPPNVELCAYRIVERLLPDGSGDRAPAVEVTVRFGSDELRVDVVGATRADTTSDDEARTTVAESAARARAQVVGGRLAATTAGRRRRVQVTIPVPVLAGGSV